MRAWWLAVVCACKGTESPPPPAPAPAPPVAVTPDARPAPQVRLVRCAPAELAPRAQLPPEPRPPPPPTIGVVANRETVVASRPEGPTGALSLGEMDVDGTLDKAITRRFLKRSISRIFECYESNTPGADANLALRYTVDDTGKVRDARVTGSHDRLGTCIADVVRTIEMPEGAHGTAKTTLTFRSLGLVPPAPPPPPKPKPKAPAHVPDVKAWTPYAAGEGLAPLDIASAAAHDLETAIRGRLDRIDACFGDRTGSVRSVMTVAFDGGVIGARTGGVGEHDVDACIAGALIGLKVAAPPIISEVACDFDRGAPAPWRLTLDGSYEVLELTQGTPPVDDIESASEHAFAIVAAPDVAGKALARAVSAVRYSQATLLAVRRDGGAPVFVGMTRDARTASSGDGEPIAIDLRGTAHACADGAALAGTPLDALRTTCASDPCGTLSIAFDASTTAGEVADQALAARAAGFTRILVGGPGCRSPR